MALTTTPDDHAAHVDRGRIAVTGASGFIGSALVSSLLAAGHTVVRISRSTATITAGDSSLVDVRWDPVQGYLDADALEALDAVIHLAGESIAQRWTGKARRRILDSRTLGTSLLARTVATLRQPPRVFVSASAVGYYGNTGDRWVDEDSPPGAGFLAAVARAWEDASTPAAAAGIRVVHPRFGVVLGKGGGALARLLPPFRLGMGGPIGDGRQWMSWVALADLVGALHFLVRTPSMVGAVNVVAPHAVTNAEFTTALGAALHRPTLGYVPPFALRMVYGQMADETLISGQRVRPARLQAAGFGFGYPTIGPALEAELG